uniref:Heparan-sulfate 6-O-sulfotransferase n=1 Tax=Gopherus agassizii TaxID=38772 RepID=A0A452HI72_9SAUR
MLFIAIHNTRTRGHSMNNRQQLDLFPTPDPHYVKKYYFPVRALERALAFDMKGEDVIVFLHIQKTGGTTFGRHLVQNVRLEVPCDCRPGQKKCTCYRPNRRETWLFSRFSTGWSCGLHADWTELTSCVPGVLDKRERQISSDNLSLSPSHQHRSAQARRLPACCGRWPHAAPGSDRLLACLCMPLVRGERLCVQPPHRAVHRDPMPTFPQGVHRDVQAAGLRQLSACLPPYLCASWGCVFLSTLPLP